MASAKPSRSSSYPGASSRATQAIIVHGRHSSGDDSYLLCCAVQCVFHILPRKGGVREVALMGCYGAAPRDMLFITLTTNGLDDPMPSVLPQDMLSPSGPSHFAPRGKVSIRT
eukprot:Sspe_Gene.66751::Locus_39433_Transcript_3_7_Confidence_0.647_Length_942::g.66751::m.66751